MSAILNRQNVLLAAVGVGLYYIYIKIKPSDGDGGNTPLAAPCNKDSDCPGDNMMCIIDTSRPGVDTGKICAWVPPAAYDTFVLSSVSGTGYQTSTTNAPNWISGWGVGLSGVPKLGTVTSASGNIVATTLQGGADLPLGNNYFTIFKNATKFTRRWILDSKMTFTTPDVKGLRMATWFVKGTSSSPASDFTGGTVMLGYNINGDSSFWFSQVKSNLIVDMAPGETIALVFTDALVSSDPVANTPYCITPANAAWTHNNLTITEIAR